MVLPDPPAYTSSEATGIDDAGFVIGRTFSPNESRATLWANGRTYDLNALIAKGTAPLLTAASSISRGGKIACEGTGADNLPHAYLLTPTGTALP